MGVPGCPIHWLPMGQILDSYNSNLENAKWRSERFEIKGWLKTGIGEVCGKDLCLSEHQ